jgi:glucose 1-dehydrogenase
MKSYSLQGQAALVTGADSGIGKGVALELAKAGAKLLINYAHNQAAADEVVNEIKVAGGEAFAFQADVSHEGEVQAMFAEMFKQYGTIDILVNNAGLQKDSKFVDMTLDQWQTVININLTGQFLCSREAAREFIRRGVVQEQGSRENYLYEQRARGNSMGRSRKLCYQQRRHHDADEKHGAGISPA